MPSVSPALYETQEKIIKAKYFLEVNKIRERVQEKVPGGLEQRTCVISKVKLKIKKQVIRFREIIY